QWLGVGEIRLQFEVDPREELGIHLKAGASNSPLVAEVGSRELPGAHLGAIEIELEPPAEIKPEVAIFRLNERAPPVEPDLDGAFLLRFVLESLILLLINLPALQQEIKELLERRFVLRLLTEGIQSAHTQSY